MAMSGPTTCASSEVERGGTASACCASWQTALGGAPEGLVEDDRKLWSGDHIVDPSYVLGILLANRPPKRADPRQTDVAPAALKAFALPPRAAMRGEALL